jgi:antitoxin (DNA-binding transcriptional repressor) of toxin-antitoxin stability system
MAEFKTVGIKDLKNNLSAYLREVRRGTRILVSDRADVVAELREPGATYAAGEKIDPVLSGWARKGTVALPTRAKEPLPVSPVKTRPGTSSRLLDDGRAERET